MEFILAVGEKVSLQSIPSIWENCLETNLVLSLSALISYPYLVLHSFTSNNFSEDVKGPKYNFPLMNNILHS